jgi:SOS-response transcriptional repressor LexA
MTPEKFLYKPQEVIRDKRLTSLEQDYLCLITSLQNAEGCTASNNYFAEYFGVKRQTAVEIISTLKRKGFISTTEKKSGGKTVERTIEIIDSDSRNYLLLDSRKSRPSDSRKLPAGIVGSSDFDSRKPPTHIVKTITKTIVGYDNDTNRLTNITSENILQWKKAYPHLDVEQQICKMESWLAANPTKHPKSNFLRFINGWLARERQNPRKEKLSRIQDSQAESIVPDDEVVYAK